jgi:hypothetical protein
MTPATPTPLPGSMTVPVWYGWQYLLVALVVVVVVTVVALLVLAAGRHESGRSDWQAWLQERSAHRRHW